MPLVSLIKWTNILQLAVCYVLSLCILKLNYTNTNTFCKEKGSNLFVVFALLIFCGLKAESVLNKSCFLA